MPEAKRHSPPTQQAEVNLAAQASTEPFNGLKSSQGVTFASINTHVVAFTDGHAVVAQDGVGGADVKKELG